MQKQKFDEIISYVNKKVSEMEIETKYKMELLGMVTALGYAHEKETHDKRTETHARDCISRQAAIDAVEKESRVDGAYGYMDTKSIVDLLNNLPAAQPESEWISTKEMEPPKPNGAKYYSLDGEDIAANEYNVMIKGATEPTSLYWSGDVWFSPYGIDAEYTYNVTHWKPLPEPYKEGEQE